MTLAAGTKLGPYEIVAPLGAGGMGEVYRARDTRLGRDVAIKVVPASLMASAEVRARFEREARTVSSLNHPNICTLYDVGREGDTEYLVMELIDGETLADRLTRGALPPPDVLKLGEQIADALDRAHRAGVVHRDLKPGNVMLTKSGAKLMDFGLARATGMAPASGSASIGSIALTQTPTMAAPLTAEGTIVGTFQYMAPEQLEGREADTRSDLWAFGCVLYEMATGKRAFEGRSQASLIAAILERQPDPPSKIAPRTPPPLDAVVARCLAKDPDDRWQNARDLMHELRLISGGSLSGAAVAVRPAGKGRSASPVLIAAVTVIAAVIGAFVGPMLMHPRRADAPPLLLSLGSIPGLIYSSNGGDLAMSPDGRSAAFIGQDSTGFISLWVRDLVSRQAHAIDGTEDAFMPFWSPDGRTVGFFAGNKLRRVSVAGGLPQDICSAAAGRGATWGRDGTILFAPGAEGPLYRVPADGGTPVVATALDTAKHEVGHRFPWLLPDGRHFFYAAVPAVDKTHDCYMGDLGSMKRTLVTRSDGTPQWSEGWLLFFRNGMLLAQRFDPRSARLSGPARPLFTATQGTGFLAAPAAYISQTGVLMTIPVLPLSERLVWRDRAGREQPIPRIPVGGWIFPRLSPDGRKVAAARATNEANSSSGLNLWTADVVTGVATRLTFEDQAVTGPLWSPDGREIIYSSNVDGTYALYRIPATGGKPTFLYRGSGLVLRAMDWSRDGRYIVFSTEDPRTSQDVWLMTLDGKPDARPLIQTAYNEVSARISPDGRWLAFGSNQSGRFEIYLESFPTPGTRMQISTNGGVAPQWSDDGHELFYSTFDGWMTSVRVRTAPELHVEAPTRLFRVTDVTLGSSVAPDGRFLYSLPDPSITTFSPIVAVNWQRMVEGAPR